MQPRKENSTARFALRISLIYALVGGVWILFSGRALAILVADPQIRARLEIYKGWAFVAVTALLLYVLLRGQLRRWEHVVAERRRMEKELHKNESFLRLVMDLVPHFIFVKDRKSRHLLVNRACAEANNRTPEQMVGLSDQDLTASPAEAESFMKDDQEVIAHGRPKFVPEEKLTDAKGRTRILQTTKVPFPSSAVSLPAAGSSADGKGEPAIVGVAVDITERKQAEDALRDSMALYLSLVEQIPAGLYRKDMDGRYVFVNALFCELNHLTPEQYLGRTAEEFASELAINGADGLEPEQVRELSRVGGGHHALIMRTGQRIEVEEERTFQDGRKQYLQVIKSPVFDSSGKIIGSQGILYDITQRKEAEAALRDSMALYHSLVEQIPAGLFRKNAEGEYVFVNSWFCRIKGVKAELFLGKKPQEVAAVEVKVTGANPSQINRLAAQGKDHHQQIMETGRQIEVEEHGVGPDGNEQYLQVIKSPLFDSNGKVVGSQGILYDITPRKQAEAALARERSLLRTLIDNLPVAIYAKDTAGRKTLANPADYKNYHCKAEAEAIGKTDFDLFPKEAAEKFWADDQKVIQGQMVIDREEYFLSDEGQRRWLLTSKLPLRDQNGKIIGLVGIGRDITERKQVEEELRRLNQSLQTLSKCNEVLVRAADETTLLEKICQIVTEIGGYRLAWVGYAEQNEAKSVRPVACTGAEDGYLKHLRVTWADTEPGRGPVGTAIRTGQPAIFMNLAEHPNFKPWREEALRCGLASCVGLPLKADDKTFGVLCVYSSCADAFNATETRLLIELANDLAFGITTLRSRSERKQLEEQLRQSQKMEAIGQLAGGVAHDFNNMLTVIQGNASMLLNPQLNAAEQKESAQQIFRAAERAASLTRQLLVFSRKQVMQAVPLNLNETVSSMTKMLQRILGEDICLNANYAGNLPVILADPGMIEQILMNLAVNSRDAMPKGGRLTITTGAETLDEKTAEKRAGISPGLYVCLTVTDTGCGIAPETLPRIFEPFYTTKEAGKGTGLGLATVYGIVQQHHGWIDVNSQAGQGTSFRIYLPAAKDQLPKSSAASVVSKLPGGNETILLVEDEPPVRLLASNLLRRCGYTVLVAESGTAALPIWQEHRERINLLLTDMVMPEGVSGRELAERLTADRPELKVVYTSGYSTELIGKEPRLIEGRNFLQKPYHPLKLAQIIRDCLNQNGKTS